jgi:hypothetical protein
MSAVAVPLDGERELRECYERYKRLTLATGAALLLGPAPNALADAAAALLEDCRHAAARAPAALASQLRACAAASDELRELLGHAELCHTAVSSDEIERVRATHRRLRREVWKVLPCEYVPCAASRRPAHER